VTASIPTRIRRIIEEYGGKDPATLAQLDEALHALTRVLGHKRVAWLSDCLRGGDLPTVVETLLVEYYDPRYLHAMRNYRYALEVSSEDLGACVGELRAFAAGLPAEPPRVASAS